MRVTSGPEYLRREKPQLARAAESNPKTAIRRVNFIVLPRVLPGFLPLAQKNKYSQTYASENAPTNSTCGDQRN